MFTIRMKHQFQYKNYILFNIKLWTEVCNIVQEAAIKTIHKKKKCKETKWLSEEALQIAEKKRSKSQKRKGMIYPFECRVSKNSKER